MAKKSKADLAKEKAAEKQAKADEKAKAAEEKKAAALKEKEEKAAAKAEEAAKKKAEKEEAAKVKAEEKKAKADEAAAKKAEEAAAASGNLICSNCEHCFHDVKSANPKPRCIQEDKALDRTDKTPSWCPEAGKPQVSEDTGMPIPENCGDCEFMAHDTEACVRDGKAIKDSCKRRGNCPLVKESNESNEE